MPAPTHDDGVWSWDPPEVESCCGLPADHVHEAAPETGPSRPGFGGAVGLATRRPTTRMGNVWVLRDALARAASGAMTGPAGDALRAVLSGSTRLRLQARSRGDIETALRLADEFGFQPILEEASEAHHLVDMLAARQVPVIFGPLFDAPTGVRAQTGETDEATVGTPRLLAARGVPFCLTAADRQGEDDLWGQALLAVRFGLSRDRALEAVTGAPARILGGEVARRLGKLEPGRDADIVVWSGAPLAPTSRPLAVLIDGELVAGALPTGIAAHHAKPAPAGRGDF